MMPNTIKKDQVFTYSLLQGGEWDYTLQRTKGHDTLEILSLATTQLYQNGCTGLRNAQWFPSFALSLAACAQVYSVIGR